MNRPIPMPEEPKNTTAEIAKTTLFLARRTNADETKTKNINALRYHSGCGGFTLGFKPNMLIGRRSIYLINGSWCMTFAINEFKFRVTHNMTHQMRYGISKVFTLFLSAVPYHPCSSVCRPRKNPEAMKKNGTAADARCVPTKSSNNCDKPRTGVYGA